MVAKRYETTDAGWERIKGIFHHAKANRPPKDDRMVLKGMLRLARNRAA